MPSSTPKARPGHGSPSERRRHGRLGGEGGCCNLGPILDISAGGMRVLTDRRIRGTQVIAIAHPDRGQIQVHASVAWCKRLGLGRFAAGLQFMDVTPEIRRQLLLARFHDVRQGTFSPEERAATVRPSRSSAIPFFLVLATLALAGAWAAGVVPLGADDLAIIGGVAVVLLLMTRGAGEHTPKRLRTRPGDLASEIASLRESQALLARLLHGSLDAVMYLRSLAPSSTPGDRLEFQLVNNSAAQMLGISTELLVGSVATPQIPLFRDTPILEDARSVLETGLPTRREVRVGSSDRWVSYSITPAHKGVLITISDVTERRRTQDLLERVAFHDPLTGLANRKRLMDRLGASVHRRRHAGASPFALLFLDCDRFKVINDSLGHDAGDQLLLSIAARLRGYFGVPGNHAESEPVLLSRLGGDEFVILLDRPGSIEDARRAADELVQILGKPHEIRGSSIVCSASIGMVWADASYTGAEAVLRDADIAMYAAKGAGKGRWVLFDHHMRQAASTRLELERDLRAALLDGQFSLAFEPIVSADTGALFGVEALLRWNHPTQGLIPPSAFIPVAEEIGAMPAAGEWVLREACGHARRTAVSRSVPLAFSVNVSRTELLRSDAADRIERVVRESGAAPTSIIIEIPETIVTADRAEIVKVVESLKRAGLRIALDDFGIGASSLHAINELPIDILKIDRALIGAEGAGLRSPAVINTAVELARQLRIAVVAEGVERPEQAALLQAMGCHYLQGRLFGNGLEPAAFGDFESLHRTRRASA